MSIDLELPAAVNGSGRQCGNEANHRAHVWYGPEDSYFCDGFVGRAGVPAAEPEPEMSIDEMYDLIEAQMAEIGTSHHRITELGDSIAALRKQVAQRIADREVRLVGPIAPGDDLTEAERRIAAFLPSAMTAPEIGRHLYLTVNTVKTHMKNIYRKLGVGTRAQAVAMLATRKREQRTGGES